MVKEGQKKQKAVVIGGGIAGLAVAALLAKQGWSVTVLEKNASLGGRARTLSLRGFQFDMGPSWYLMPEVFERYFAEFGKKVSDYYQLIRLNPRYKIYFEKNESIVLTDSIDQNKAELEKLESGAGNQLIAFLHNAKSIYDVAIGSLIYQNIWSPLKLVNLTNIKALLQISVTLPFWQTWWDHLGGLFKSQKIKQILGFTALFLGGSPAMTPSMFSILAWADFGLGVWYPKGGMKKVVDAFVTVCKEQGVVLRTNQAAEQIVVHDGSVTGVRTNHKQFDADIVVGAADLPWMEANLLEPENQTYPESYWVKKNMGISTLMIYIGLNKHFPSLVHHSLYFSNDWEKNFSEIFTSKTIPKDPSLYISIRSVTDRSIVPRNGEELVMLVPLGTNTSYSTKQLNALSDQVIAKAEKVLKIPLQQHIVVKKLFTPQDFVHDYNAYKGSALGLAHTASQSLWWRPKHRSNKVKGLYYAGQYVNPGVGVPTSIVSAQVVAKMIGYASTIQDTVFKNGSTTYYYSSLYFKGQTKQDVITLYAYVRVIDDFVDKSSPDLQLLEQYWQQTLLAWKDGTSTIPIVDQFVRMVKRKELEWDWIDAFWQAMRSDLTKKIYKNFKELDAYMYGSSEVIGLMMAKILDLPKEAMKTAAVQGKAMQLLNFIRDVDEDRKLNRKYLVYDDSCRSDAMKWDKCVQVYLHKYYALQEQAEKGYRYIPKKYLIPIKTAAQMYKNTATIIERRPMIVWEKKVKPTKWQVLVSLMINSLK